MPYLKQFTSSIKKRTGIQSKIIKKVITELEKELFDRLARGEEVHIVRVGKFQQKVFKGRTWYSGIAMKEVSYDDFYTIQWKTSLLLRKELRKRTVYKGRFDNH